MLLSKFALRTLAGLALHLISAVARIHGGGDGSADKSFLLPPIYWIHLARRTDRLEAARGRSDPDAWTAIRVVDAFDAHVPREDLLERFRALGARPFPQWVIMNLSDPVLFRRPGTGKPFSGELGKRPVPYNVRWYCSQQTAGTLGSGISHREAWARVAAGPEPWAIVLEDDQALPSLSALVNLTKALVDLGSFDIVYLKKGSLALFGDEAQHGKSKKREAVVSEAKLRPLLWTFGAQAYVLSRSFAKVLLDLHFLRCLTAVDEVLGYAFNPDGHPRRERWADCLGQPPSDRHAWLYSSPEPVVVGLKSASDNEPDPARFRSEQNVVDWLDEQLSEPPLGQTVREELEEAQRLEV
eukprot:gnl/TRDRNA2_/TRDRNA2_193531_c0_seq1.p1 gnl/TRDRNA2_/TRDRNA2_193531_c0~~gnl/TRDRNA2_/TRDRNA2_193531_c0_seq1.p1  ORF type:complete len:355 (+),score=43.55 gnl/TRDRNA2_/TRDRNA2_193531_c0_seq1:159-1223(+)